MIVVAAVFFGVVVRNGVYWYCVSIKIAVLAAASTYFPLLVLLIFL